MPLKGHDFHVILSNWMHTIEELNVAWNHIILPEEQYQSFRRKISKFEGEKYYSLTQNKKNIDKMTLRTRRRDRTGRCQWV